MSRLSLSHIDTCLGCYLTDHHNRDGELLLGVAVDGSTTNKQVREGLVEEFNSSDREIEVGDTPLDLDDEFEKALDEEIPATILNLPFDDSLPIEDEPDGEGPQAWFLLIWTPA